MPRPRRHHSCVASRFLRDAAHASQLLHVSDYVAALHYSLPGGLQLTLKLTLEARASFGHRQLCAEVDAAQLLPVCARLRPLLAWRADGDGNMLGVSLAAGDTVEALLARDASQGGWRDLPLPARVQLCRQVLAGMLLALDDMAPMLHHDLKPANVAVAPAAARHASGRDAAWTTALLDFGAAKHADALLSPRRRSVYAVISEEHVDAALLERTPDGRYLLETECGCRQALSCGTDLLCASLTAFKIIMGGDMPGWLTWESHMHAPHSDREAALWWQSLEDAYQDLEWGCSRCPQVAAVLRALPPECPSALQRLCAFSAASRPSLQQALQLRFVEDTIQQLRRASAQQGGVYAAAHQQAIDLLQCVPGIRLARPPSGGAHGGGSSRHESGAGSSTGSGGVQRSSS
jgi:hypothetical protein